MADEVKGVQMVEPAGPLMRAVNASVREAVEALPAGARGGIVAVATTEGVNLAIVQRFSSGWDVVGYVGKKWGTPLEGGAVVRKTW